jgi:hypothetical protein
MIIIMLASTIAFANENGTKFIEAPWKYGALY